MCGSFDRSFIHSFVSSNRIDVRRRRRAFAPGPCVASGAHTHARTTTAAAAAAAAAARPCVTTVVVHLECLEFKPTFFRPRRPHSATRMSRNRIDADGFITACDVEDVDVDVLDARASSSSMALRCVGGDDDDGAEAWRGRWRYTSTAALLKTRALERATDALERAREQGRVRAVECEARERDVRAAQARIRGDVVRFEAFARENEVKRHAALRRAKEEREANTARDVRLGEMREELYSRAREARALDRALVRVKVFEEFLARVADEASLGEAFEDIADVLGRHDTLARAYDSLRTSVVAANARVEEMREALEKSVKSMAEERLTTTATTARLRLRDEDLRRENSRLEQDAAYKARATVERMRQLAEAKLAVRNLADRCARDGQRAAEGFAQQLDFVDARARVLREIAATTPTSAI